MLPGPILDRSGPARSLRASSPRSGRRRDEGEPPRKICSSISSRGHRGRPRTRSGSARGLMAQSRPGSNPLHCSLRSAPMWIWPFSSSSLRMSWPRMGASSWAPCQADAGGDAPSTPASAWPGSAACGAQVSVAFTDGEHGYQWNSPRWEGTDCLRYRSSDLQQRFRKPHPAPGQSIRLARGDWRLLLQPTMRQPSTLPISPRLQLRRRSDSQRHGACTE
jgi:hypothetical protein